MRLLRAAFVVGSLRVLWLAFLGVGLASIAYSYRQPIVISIVHGDLYGVELRRGDVVFFRGQHIGANDPAVRGSWMPWDAKDAISQTGFLDATILQPADLLRPIQSKNWPPFWNVTGGGYTWTRKNGTGVLIYDQWGRWLDRRGGSAWLVLFLASLPLTFRSVAGLRRKPIPGRCEACGYDLRATPDRCPECGRETRDAHIADAT